MSVLSWLWMCSHGGARLGTEILDDELLDVAIPLMQLKQCLQV